MKIPISISLVGMIAAMVAPLLAYPVEGDSLNIGDNTITTNGYAGSAIGSSNSISYSVDSSLIVGLYNNLTYASLGMAVGYGNLGAVDCSMILGNINESYDVSSFVGGEYNITSTYCSLVFGSNNIVDGSYQFAFGHGLIGSTGWQATPTLFLGRYNKPVSSTPLLILGNGTSAAANQQSNALEVYLDGKIRIPKRQGDVGMGRFTSVTADK